MSYLYQGFKPRPHFEDVVRNKQKAKLKYPPRTYLMRDSLYYDNLAGMPDPAVDAQQKLVKVLEGLIPNARDAINEARVAFLPANLQHALLGQQRHPIKEEAEAARQEQLKVLKEKAEVRNKEKVMSKVKQALNMYKQQKEQERQQTQNDSATQINALVRGFLGRRKAAELRDQEKHIQNIMSLEAAPSKQKSQAERLKGHDDNLSSASTAVDKFGNYGPPYAGRGRPSNLHINHVKKPTDKFNKVYLKEQKKIEKNQDRKQEIGVQSAFTRLKKFSENEKIKELKDTPKNISQSSLVFHLSTPDNKK